jgi:hypothetical protein
MTRTVPRRAAPPPTVHGITSARSSQTEDAAARTLRYLISMAVRTVCFILAVVVPSPWRWIFVAGAVLPPLFAVVVANVGGGRRSPVSAPVELGPLELGTTVPRADRVIVVDAAGDDDAVPDDGSSDGPGSRES